MLIERLQVRGLLSFGPKGIDLELEPLNVLIGPNGSGKSNLLAVLGLLRATTGDLGAYLDETGGYREWSWRGPSRHGERHRHPSINATVRLPRGKGTLQHGLSTFLGHDGWIIGEFLRRRNNAGDDIVSIHETSDLPLPDGFTENQSVMAQTGCVPSASELRWLSKRYAAIRLYRNWTFGAGAPTRRGQNAELAGDVLIEGADNLASVIAGFSASRRDKLTDYLRRFYDRVVGISTPVRDGKVSLVVEESDGGVMPASRLSDGTLRYLSLLAVLLDPNPPPLIAIEEPELGLHPDIVPDLVKLMLEASERTQLVVATHSPVFVDELTEHPSSVVAFDHYDGETRCRRVNPEAMSVWLNEHNLGAVWASGGIGGNRW